MSKLVTDFSQKKLSIVTGVIFILVGFYEILTMSHFMNGFRFLFSGILLVFFAFIFIKGKLIGKEKTNFNAAYGLIIVGSFIKVLGTIGSYFIWILGVFLLIKSLINNLER